jgi:hypothetical protein
MYRQTTVQNFAFHCSLQVSLGARLRANQQMKTKEEKWGDERVKTREGAKEYSKPVSESKKKKNSRLRPEDISITWTQDTASVCPEHSPSLENVALLTDRRSNRNPCI